VPDRRRVPSLLELAYAITAVSLTAFGGGQKAQIRRRFVSQERWITDQEFIEALEVAELLPGPNVLNLAIFIGQRVRGIPGALVAAFAGSVAPFCIVLFAGAIYFSKFNTPLVHAALNGAAAGAVGLTLANALELTAATGGRPLSLIFIAATTLAVSAFKLSLILTLPIFGGLSMSIYALSVRKRKSLTR